MTNLIPRRRTRRIGALALLLISVLPAAARPARESWARDKFENAARLREALTAQPQGQRSRHDYQRVIDAYRRVYLGCPTCTKADPSVVATAELLLQMGRQFKDDTLLRSAIKQYQFLRREYPGSKSRPNALFTIAEIYKDDLDQPADARATFQEFLRRYPRHRLAEDATEALAAFRQDDRRKADSKHDQDASAEQSNEDKQQTAVSGSETKPGKYTRVTGILHWTTPDSARVAIDLEQDVQFKSERLDHPSRIYFDLRDTHLAASLVGKIFDVEAGPLKKIRVSQFERGRSRVVLEVDPQSEYKAFLLPNPNRLVIQIYGKTKPAAEESARTHAGVFKGGPDLIEIQTLASTRLIQPTDPGLDNRLSERITEHQAAPIVTTAITKRIVEADDDDADDGGEDAKATRPRKSGLPDSKRLQKTAPAASTGLPHRKRRSADGNNDEIATLNPSDTSLEAVPSAVPALPEIPTKSKPTRPQSKLDSVMDMREAQPTMAGDRSLIRALGLKIGRIVIDPGHGGHDTGTIGPNGVEEKNVVLDVAKRLGKLLRTRMGADVVFTRRDDTFIPLETRTAIANHEQADLFVSIHANSSHDEDARGVETYYLNFTSNAGALEVAARENATSDQSIHELQDLVKKIALKEKIEESREFATDVQRSLHSGLAVKNSGLRDRGVKKAPFVVLIGANMPSILAEISFVSNPTDERKLDTPEYRQRIAESLYKGIAKYVNGLSGVKVASRLTKSESQ